MPESAESCLATSGPNRVIDHGNRHRRRHQIEASKERLNGIQAAERAGVEIPHYCWHAGLSVVASCRMCLVETGTQERQDGQDRDAAQAGAGLPDAGQRRHGVRHQQREGRKTAGRMVEEDSAARPSDRLPDLRQSRRVHAARLPLRARPGRAPGRHQAVHQPPARAWATRSRCSSIAA